MRTIISLNITCMSVVSCLCVLLLIFFILQMFFNVNASIFAVCIIVQRGSSVVECWTRNQVSPGSNPTLLPFRKLGIFVLSIDAHVNSAA